MTLFAFYCRDGENGATLRERLLADHLAHIEAHIDDFAVAGPLKDGDETVGSLVIIKAENEAEARAKFEADPYYAAGVWQSIRASHFLGVAGDWVGGKAWKM
ncbi:MAG: YciI family protein [Pseudomonadota bacterium]